MVLNSFFTPPDGLPKVNRDSSPDGKRIAGSKMAIKDRRGFTRQLRFEDKLSCAPLLICDVVNREKEIITVPFVLQVQVKDVVTAYIESAIFGAVPISYTAQLESPLQARRVTRGETCQRQKSRGERNCFASFHKLGPSVGDIEVGA